MSAPGTGEVARAHVARLFYLRGLTKQQIAARLGVSRFKVARLLDQAVADGTVRIEVRDPVAVDDAAAAGLEAAFGLDLAVVVRGDAGDVARTAAAWMPQLLAPGDVLGVAWGSTLRRVLEALPAAPGARIPVVQLCGSAAGVDPDDDPQGLARRAAERLGGALHPLPVPLLVSPAARLDLLANDAVRPTVERFDDVTVALVGIGALDGRSSLVGGGRIGADEVATLRARGAVGDLIVHLFDAGGAIVPSDLPERAVAPSLAQLRGVRRVVAVAGGPGKDAAILGALRTGLVDVLVTDEASARAALAAG